MNNKIKKLSLSGFGMSSLIYLGSLNYLQDNQLLDDLQEFHGFSAGAVLSLFLSIEKDVNNIIDFLSSLKFKDYIKISILKFYKRLGLEDCNLFLNLLKKFIFNYLKTNELTFKQHFDITKKKLCIYSFNLSQSKIVSFDYINSPNLNVLDAIRASISIPLLFTPFKINNDYYIDPGFCVKYPINFIDDCSDCLVLTINSSISFDKLSFFGFLHNICYSMCNYFDHLCNKTKLEKCKVIELNRFENTGILTVDLNSDDFLNIIHNGYQQMKNIYLNNIYTSNEKS